MKQIQVTRSSMPLFEEYCEEIKKLWDSHWLTNMGIEHKTLQCMLESYLQCPHVVLYTNGHLALENVIAAMQFPVGSEVITTPFTFASTTHAIVRNGLNPVFCDVDVNTYTIDAKRIESLITDKTVAIVPVHVYGNMCDVDGIDTLAHKYDLKVIYDAAHTFGVKYKDVPAVNYGDASILSFHATKVFNTIEGGAVCIKDDALVDVLNDMKNFGIRGPEDVVYVGGNAKMNEFQAAMGICNLKHIDEEILKRKRVVERYNHNLSNIKGIKLCCPQHDVEPNYAYYPVIFDEFKYSRDKVYDLLAEKGIIARKYFYPLTNSFECYKNYDAADVERTPIAQFLAERVLTLPLFADLGIKDVDLICEIITS